MRNFEYHEPTAIGDACLLLKRYKGEAVVYAEIGPRVAMKSGSTAAGPYHIPHVKIDAMAVYTHKPSVGAFRGFGVSQSAWAIESHTDMMAQALKMDPLEIRLKNAYEEGGEFVTRETLTSIGLKSCLQKVATAIRWQEKDRHPSETHFQRGKGLACLIKGTITPSASSSALKLNEDCSLTLYAGTIEMGQGSETTLALIASKELGIPLERIRVMAVDSDVVPYDLTTSSSRFTFHMGKAVQLAAQDLCQQLKYIVVAEYGVPLDQVGFANGKVQFVETTLEYGEVLDKRYGMPGGTLIGRGEVRSQTLIKPGETMTSVFWFVGAGAVEVEVNRETGKLKVLKYVTAVDVGKAINPEGCRQQLAGAAITGMGQALYEQVVFDNGQLLNPNLIDYNIPALGDMPEVIETISVEVPHTEGPYGAKGIGETSLIPVAPAIGNALYDAVGIRLKELPITSEKIFFAMERSKEKS